MHLNTRYFRLYAVENKGCVSSVVILSYLRNAIFPKSCFRRLCHSNFVNTLLYITIFCTIPRLHRHRNLLQFVFKQSSASTSTTVAKISNKSLFELFFFGTLKRKLLPLFCQKSDYLRLTTAYETMGWSMNSASITTPLGISRLIIPLAMQHPLFLVELVLLNHNHAIWNLKRTN